LPSFSLSSAAGYLATGHAGAIEGLFAFRQSLFQFSVMPHVALRGGDRHEAKDLLFGHALRLY